VTAPATDRRVVVDPRFAERRAQVERDLRRRRRNQLIGGAVVLALAAGIVGALRSSLLDVDQIQVVGATRTPVSQIVATSGIVVGQQLYDVDGTEAAHQLEALPWVRRARVARAWPGAVRISVVERQPVARVASAAGGWFLVDDSGRLLDPGGEAPDGLVLIDGVVPEGSPGMQLSDWATAAVGLVPRFPDMVATRTQGLRFVGNEADRAVQLVLRPEISGADEGREPPPPVVVEFGAVGQLATEKLLALEAVLTQVDGRCVATIDVQIPSDPRVTRLEWCE
jgi:xanthosine utilization system XapX-like protein